jgi:WD40 repeat protein
MIDTLTFSQDGATLAVGGSNATQLWDTTSGRQVLKIDRFSDAARRRPQRVLWTVGGGEVLLDFGVPELVDRADGM